MEFLGVAAFILAMGNIGLKDKVDKLAKDVKKLKRGNKGDNKMSEILKSLEGKRCIITYSGSISGPRECDVLNVDDEWIKVNYIGKKGAIETKIIRIEKINEVSLV